MNTYKENNRQRDYSICPKCGGRYVHESFMVADGHDDVDWDFDEWCENPSCPLIETNTDFGSVKNSDNKKESIIL